MRQALLVTVIGLLASPAFSATPDTSKTLASETKPFNCLDLRKASQKLPVYASNIENKDTSKTAEGGPYKRIDLVCKETFCETVPREDFRLIQDPSNPNANSNGYVQLPRIDVASEFAGLQSAAAEVRLLAGAQACGASALTTPTMALVKYDAGTSIQSDTFTFSNDGRLTAWSRTLRDGTSQHFAFAADGSIVKNQ
jgi:flagellar basal-body rod protein FlgC